MSIQYQVCPGCGQPAQVAPARTWGDLGLGGEWKDKPIHLYTFDLTSGTGTYFRHASQGDSKKMNWEIIHEYSDQRRPDGTSYEAGEQAMDALQRDRYGLAVSSLRYANSNCQGCGARRNQRLAVCAGIARYPGQRRLSAHPDDLRLRQPAPRTTCTRPGQRVPAFCVQR